MAEEKLIEPLNEIIKEYNGRVAQWHKNDFKGKMPINILVCIGKMYNEAEDFIKRYKGTWD